MWYPKNLSNPHLAVRTLNQSNYEVMLPSGVAAIKIHLLLESYGCQTQALMRRNPRTLNPKPLNPRPNSIPGFRVEVENVWTFLP